MAALPSYQVLDLLRRIPGVPGLRPLWVWVTTPPLGRWFLLGLLKLRFWFRVGFDLRSIYIYVHLFTVGLGFIEGRLGFI